MSTLQGTQGKVRQCLFQDNVAEYGGAVFRGSTTGNINGCVFLSNKASKIGGAIYDSHVQARVLLIPSFCSSASHDHACMLWPTCELQEVTDPLTQLDCKGTFSAFITGGDPAHSAGCVQPT